MESDQILENIVRELFNPLYSLAVGVAFLYFMYGAFMFVVSMNDPEKKNNGKRHLFWGLVGLFIILSVGGILKVFGSIFEGMFVF